MLSSSDTVMMDNALQPYSIYAYRAYRLIDSTRLDSTAIVEITTMDTTSHIYVWTIDTLGDATSSLRDVAVIDEDNIWVVGKIDLKDPSGQQYNVASFWCKNGSGKLC